MRRNGTHKIFSWKIAALGVTALFMTIACSMAPIEQLPQKHPEQLGKGLAVCSSCHDKPGALSFSTFDHVGEWNRKHRLGSYGRERICKMCHEANFCSGCHAPNQELKPSIGRQSDTYRDLPHRGDYLSRHRIDARIDPTGCFRCHGNPRSSRTCVPCHG